MFNIFKKLIKFNYIFLMVITVNLKANTLNNIYNYNFMDIDGNIINLNAFVGKPILLVNTASKCGFTPQYGDLQNLFQKYKNTDLVFIATPSNDFKQELSSEDEIKKYCLINYGVSFNVTEIVKLKGDNAHPAYKWLKNKYKKEPKWNFYKYLFNREGELVKSWSSITKPSSPKIEKSINKVL
tara:strand:- start:8254 stop:8802 length:549 start_codon:yes stop_codon:yes gene_type:complete